MIDLQYRPDVDGLRAVAVGLVVLFHAGLGFSGGFIGVDIFFVISGFLITGLILKEQDAGRFSLGNFWVRRIRRILPAATVMVVAVLVAGYFLLLPGDYADLGKSTIAQQLMMSNFHFWRNTGYFADQSELKPLLHTWSLAVEEQFYLGYPLVLMLCHHFGRKATFATLFTLCVGSLVFSQYGALHYPSATFFLLPTRAWELLLGGLICFFPKPSKVPQWALAGTSWVSLATIIGTGWFYTSATVFPGFSAFAPCAATATLIYVNSIRPSFPAAVLATKPVVFVGLISYSLYLWHWPVLAFYRYWQEEAISLPKALLLLACATALSVFSWRFIERPFRSRSKPEKRQKVFWIAGASCIVLIAGAGGIILLNGVASRVPPDAIRFAAFKNSRQFIHQVGVAQASRGEFPRLGNTRASKFGILWGDSHAMAVAPGLNVACEKLGICVFQATYSSTPPILDLVSVSKYGLNENAPAFNSSVLRFAVEKRVEVVFLSGVWSSYATDDEFEEKLKKTISTLTSNGIRVGVVLDVAQHDVDVPRYFARKSFWRLPTTYDGISVESHREKNRSADKLIQKACEGDPLASVLDPALMFVDSDGIWQAKIDDKLMVRDESHLSIEGGLRLEPMFLQYLGSLVRKD